MSPHKGPRGTTRTWGRAADLGIDADAAWVTVCEAHGAIVESATRDLARDTKTTEFCDDCRAAAPHPAG